MNPGGQLHDPLCLSQTPPFSQAGQVSVQPGPQKPSGHTVKALIISEILIMQKCCAYSVLSCRKICLHSQFSQCFPDVPGGHLHCPVTLSHGAPVQLQGWTQPVPNLPSGQSDTGNTGGICLNTAEQNWSKWALKNEKAPHTLITVLPVTTRRALSLALPSHMITGNSWRAGALLLTAGSISTWVAFWRRSRTEHSLFTLRCSSVGE